MQLAERTSIAYRRKPRVVSIFGWLQAGFSVFAYRLAHLEVPRLSAILGVALSFYFL